MQSMLIYDVRIAPQKSKCYGMGSLLAELAPKFPEDAAILLSNTRDGRSLKNRGYRSKESVDRLAPDFDREARSEGLREFGL